MAPAAPAGRLQLGHRGVGLPPHRQLPGQAPLRQRLPARVADVAAEGEGVLQVLDRRVAVAVQQLQLGQLGQRVGQERVPVLEAGQPQRLGHQRLGLAVLSQLQVGAGPHGQRPGQLADLVVLRRQPAGRAQRLQRVAVAAGVVERDAADAEDPGVLGRAVGQLGRPVEPGDGLVLPALLHRHPAQLAVGRRGGRTLVALLPDGDGVVQGDRALGVRAAEAVDERAAQAGQGPDLQRRIVDPGRQVHGPAQAVQPGLDRPGGHGRLAGVELGDDAGPPLRRRAGAAAGRHAGRRGQGRARRDAELLGEEPGGGGDVPSGALASPAMARAWTSSSWWASSSGWSSTRRPAARAASSRRPSAIPLRAASLR